MEVFGTDSKVMAERITQEIERKGISKKDFSVVIGASDVMVSYWCNGKRVPLLQQFVDMAEYFGVTVDYMVGLSDVPHRAPTLADDLGLSDYAMANLRSIASESDRRELLNRLLEFSGLSSVLANLVHARQLRNKTAGNIETVDLPEELVAEVSKYGYEILSNRESAERIESKAMEQLLRALKWGSGDRRTTTWHLAQKK